MLVFRLSSKAEYCKTILHLKGYQSQAKDCYIQMITTHKGADFDAAAYLLQQGEDLSVLSSFLKPAYGENQRKVLTRMLQSAKKPG